MPTLETTTPIKGIIRAWRDHYIAKGCGPFKAGQLAWKKRNNANFPPVQKEPTT